MNNKNIRLQILREKIEDNYSLAIRENDREMARPYWQEFLFYATLYQAIENKEEGEFKK